MEKIKSKLAKLAYIDHRLRFVPESFLNALRSAEIDFRPYPSFEEFYKENNLGDFPVLICHPGLKSQTLLSELSEKFPKLKIGVVSFTEYEYLDSDVPLFSYESPDSVTKYVLENQ